jgi:hypothetical protein
MQTKTKIIGISGKAGHGKDTAADWLIRKYSGTHYIEKKSWAHKLKMIVAILSETTLEQNLTAEGKKIMSPLFGLTLGEMQQKVGTGLRQVVDEKLWIKSLFIDHTHNANMLENSSKFDNIVAIITGATPEQIQNPQSVWLPQFDTTLQNFCSALESGIKTILGNSSWNFLIHDCKLAQCTIESLTKNSSKPVDPGTQVLWIVTDSRFPNEVESIENSGGNVVRIERPGFLIRDGRDNNHISETALDNHCFKNKIINNGTLEEFIKKVEQVFEPFMTQD